MTSAVNAEEAANIANEYIYSIENLPAEVQFILGEIKRKDEEISDLEVRAFKRSNELFGRKGASGPPTPREQVTLEKAREYFDRIETLGEEKVQLALSMQRLTQRALGRLDYDLLRIRRASGDPGAFAELMYPVAPSQSFRIGPANSVAGVAASVLPVYAAQTPVQLQEAPHAPPLPISASQKRRRTNGIVAALGNSSNHSSPAPFAHPPRSRPQATHIASPVPTVRKRGPSRAATVEGIDMDEEDEEAPADEEDVKPYCYCNSPSHGEMVGCDGENCPFQWFHLECLGMKRPPQGSVWYCTECAPREGMEDDGTPVVHEKVRKRR